MTSENIPAIFSTYIIESLFLEIRMEALITGQYYGGDETLTNYVNEMRTTLVQITWPPNRLNPWASCQIRKIAGAHVRGMPGTFSPSPQISDPDMHHGTCVTHVPWCMPGSLTSGFLWKRRRGKTFPAFPAHAQPAILRIWYEAHGNAQLEYLYHKGTCHLNHISYAYSIRWFSFHTLAWLYITQLR